MIGNATRMALEGPIGRREGGGVKRAAVVAGGAVVATEVTGRATGAGERREIEKGGGSGTGKINGGQDLSDRSLREKVPRKGAGAGAGARAGGRQLTDRAAKRYVFRFSRVANFVFRTLPLSHTSPKKIQPRAAPNEHKSPLFTAGHQ